MNCQACRAVNRDNALFCWRCGVQIGMICPACQAHIPIYSLFCDICGRVVQPLAQPPVPTEMVPGTAGAPLGAESAMPARTTAPEKAVPRPSPRIKDVPAPCSAPDPLVERLRRLVPKEYADKLLAVGEGTPSGERRIVTILFSDVKGSTKMTEGLDPEVVLEIMNGAFEFLIAPIYKYEGTLARLMGDAVLAFFGAPIAHEDDPERAIRAALEIVSSAQEYAHKLEAERGISGFNVRVGINTGLVVMGEVGSDLRVEYTAMGDAINLAARMEQNAPVGGVLISHDTYRQVRGVFDVQSQAPLVVKGKTEPVQTYIVQQAKPRAFRMTSRGVEGIETHMIGREAELLALQSAYVDAIEASETHLVTVVGDAGVGKSRLLYEFDNWIELRPERVYFFKGRGAPALQSVPYGILRNLFADRFDILESDNAATALEKFRVGMGGILPPERADLVGHMVGFDFSASQAVQNLSGSPDFAKLGWAYLTNYVHALAGVQPVTIFLEDLHWADDSSLDLIEHLVTTIPQDRLLLVVLARPTLFERRPQWGEGLAGFARLELKLLSKRASQALVEEILQRVVVIPKELSDLIVAGTDGNPFFVEELVKMLLDEGVIERGSDAQEAWHVSLERLKQVHIPPTLTGILQARLDSLPRVEQSVLQRAAVVGRLFWDAAVAELAKEEVSELDVALAAIRSRELVFRHERSAFAGTEEYIFKNALLRDVTYETVLMKLRRGYHAQVAHWLEVHAGERVDEYTSLIAEHYEKAGEAEKAVSYLQRSGKKALATSSFREAVGLFERALALLPAESHESVDAAIGVGQALVRLGEFSQAQKHLEEGLALARKTGDVGNCAEALTSLGWAAQEQGEWARARQQLGESITLARQTGDKARLASALLNLGIVDWRQGAYVECEARWVESLTLYRELSNRQEQTRVLNALAWVNDLLGRHRESINLTLESLALSREMGNRHGEATALENLGEIARLQGDYITAKQYYLEGMAILKEIDARAGLCIILGNLGHTTSALNDYAAARSYYCEALEMTKSIGAIPVTLDILSGLVNLEERSGRVEQTLEWLGLVMNHPALSTETRRQFIDPTLAHLREIMSVEVIEAGLERGKKLMLESVVADILRQR
jgi:class 3 adenylate cyclase/tetratricopeptide (TPR) repeat protein